MKPEDALVHIMPFGKYKGKSMKEIVEKDPKYIDWLAGLENLSGPLKTAVIYVSRQYSREISEAIGDD